MKKTQPSKLSKNPHPKKAVTSLSNNELKTLAAKHERYTQNNNTFNGKNMSDHTKVSNLHSIKENPGQLNSINYIAQ